MYAERAGDVVSPALSVNLAGSSGPGDYTAVPA